MQFKAIDSPAKMFQAMKDNLAAVLKVPFEDKLFLGTGVDAMTGKMKLEILNLKGSLIRANGSKEHRNHLSTSTQREMEKTIKTIVEAEVERTVLLLGPVLNL
jgi:hypothetical protein